MDRHYVLQLQKAQEHYRAAKNNFRRNHRYLDADQLDLEWNRLCSSSSTGVGVGLGLGHPPDVPRTMSWTGWSGGSQLTTLDDTLPVEMTRSQGLSIQSAPESLARSPSAASGYDLYPTMSASFSRSPSSSAYRTATAGNYTTSPATTTRRKRRRDPLPKVVEYDPKEYLSAVSAHTDVNTTNPALLAHQLPAPYYQDGTHLTVTTAPMLDRSSSYDGSSSPSTPATALTDASTLSSQMMSRNGSIASTQSAVNNSFVQAVDMLRFESNMSNFSFIDAAESKAALPVAADYGDDGMAGFASSDQYGYAHLVAHHDGQDLDLSPTSTFNFSSQLSPSSDATFVMQSSWSSQNSESDLSRCQSRSSCQHQEPIRRPDNCRIAPRLDASKESSSSSAPMVRVKSSDGSVQMKALISRKEPYQRRQHAKLSCPYCDRYPDGFRGEHELQRHTNRAHPSGIRKVWICEDIYGQKPEFLANCKACRTQKRYGAYYNAAAHLRRTHFNPRKRGRKAKTDAEKRGGKGGGDWPPMDILKGEWMREIEEAVTPNSAPVEDYDDSGANLANDVDDEDEQVYADQLSISPGSISPADDYYNDGSWQDSAFQFAAVPEGLDVSSASSYLSSYDSSSQQGVYADPEMELLQLEQSYQWTQ